MNGLNLPPDSPPSTSPAAPTSMPSTPHKIVSGRAITEGSAKISPEQQVKATAVLRRESLGSAPEVAAFQVAEIQTLTAAQIKTKSLVARTLPMPPPLPERRNLTQSKQSEGVILSNLQRVIRSVIKVCLNVIFSVKYREFKKEVQQIETLKNKIEKFEEHLIIPTSAAMRTMQREKLIELAGETEEIEKLFARFENDLVMMPKLGQLGELAVRVTSMQANLSGQITERTNIREGLDIVIQLDLDKPDRAGIAIKSATQVIHNEMPLVITSSLISGSNKVVNGLSNVSHFMDAVMQKVQAGQLEVYRNKETGFFLFLPKSYPPADAPDRLKQLGFDVRNLSRIPDDAVESELKTPPKNAATMESLYNIFDKSSPVKKRVLIEGHGAYSVKDEGGHIVGLSVDKYQQLLGFLNEIGTEYLSVVSCYAAGRNSMKHIAKDASCNQQQLKFPVVLHASSDMPVELLFRNARTFFQDINTMLNRNAPMTEQTFSTLMLGIENGLIQEAEGCKTFLRQLGEEIPEKGEIEAGRLIQKIKEKDPELAAAIDYFKHIMPKLKDELADPTRKIRRKRDPFSFERGIRKTAGRL